MNVGRVRGKLEARGLTDDGAIRVRVAHVGEQGGREGHRAVDGDVASGSVGAGGSDPGNAEAGEQSAGFDGGNLVVEEAAEDADLGVEVVVDADVLFAIVEDVASRPGQRAVVHCSGRESWSRCPSRRPARSG